MSKRAPLADIPNAVNSPNRAVAQIGTKRARSHAADQRELAYGQPPPAKRQLLQTEDHETRRNALLQKTSNQPPTTLQRRLEASRDGPRPAKTVPPNIEDIRQWQRHYRKVFPQIVFYFDNVPEDVRERVKRQVKSLGARDEIFFSKAVTHVVTTRAIPQDINSSSSTTGRSPESKRDANVQGQTINPLLLETKQIRNKFALETTLQKRGQTSGTNTDTILHKAKAMGCKIWKLEKLERMIHTMFNTDTGEQVIPNASRPPTATSRKDADLSQLLQHEKKHGAVDQQWMSDMVPFRGCYIFVHDMDEVTRPVMMRDYPKPATKELGKWPQLRVNGPGRCPFLEETEASKRARAIEQKREAQKEWEMKGRTRAAAAAKQAAQEEPSPVEEGILKENNNLAKRNRSVSELITQEKPLAKPMDPPTGKLALKRGSTDNLPLFGSAQASLRKMPRFVGGEPVASGVQPSNVTSAIKSQMISSTAAAPGAKGGTSKEYNALKRKVLERNNMPAAYLNDIRAAINNADASAIPTRTTKRKAEALQHIEEEVMVITDEEPHEQPRRKASNVVRKKKAVKELKPGYCENCREKFNDFDEHIVSRTHRKFAMDNENWKELDGLLSQLIRPLKAE